MCSIWNRLLCAVLFLSSMASSVGAQTVFFDVSFDDHEVDGIVLRHEPVDTCDDPGIAGHIHPTVRLGLGRGDRLRAPAFWLRSNQLVLPAFGSFTGGCNIAASTGERLFAIGPDAVVEVAHAAVV